MAKKKMTTGKYKGKQRMVIENSEEEMTLKDARSYFPDARTFMCIGLNYELDGKNASGAYQNVKMHSISPKNWERIEVYAALFRNIGRYNPKTFKRPKLEHRILRADEAVVSQVSRRTSR